jgi:hypothetical protein
VFILDMRTYKDPNSNDLPLGLVVGDGPGTYEGVGQGDNGAAAHHYDPARAAVGDFTPFWEFVSGRPRRARSARTAGRDVRALWTGTLPPFLTRIGEGSRGAACCK